MLLRRNQSRPPGRRSRCASGIQRCGSHQMLAPYSETARSKLSDGQRHVLGARLDEREVEPDLGLAAARRRELRRRDVDADRAGAAPGEPGGDVRGAAAELDDVEPVDVAERAERASGTSEDAPGDLGLGPAARARRRRCTRRSPASSPRGCAARRRRARTSAGPQTRPSGKNSASSRFALALESEPCTMFSDSWWRSRRGSCRAPSRQGSWRPSSRGCRGSRSRRGRRARARGPT